MFIGIDVGDTKMGIGLVNDKGELSFDNTFPIDSDQNLEKLMLDIIYIAKNISETVPLELFNDRITGIGICIEDILDKKSSTQSIVQQYFDVPVFVESLEAAMELAEDKIGKFKGNINNVGIIAAGLLCIGRV